MNLLVPVVQVTPGPAWAQDINDSLAIIDAHDHTAGSGVLVPTAGLNINADLPINGFNLISIRTMRLQSQVSSPSNPSDLQILYSKSDGNLYYKDINSNEIQITSAGALGTVTGTITGLVAPASANYSTITKTLTVLEDTNRPAKLSVSDISISEFTNPAANPVTLKVASVSSPYSITFMSQLPTNISPVYIQPNGGLLLLNDGYVEGTFTSSFSLSTGSNTVITNTAVSLDTITNRPVQLGFKTTSATSSYITLTSGGGNFAGTILVIRNNVTVISTPISLPPGQYPLNAFTFIDNPGFSGGTPTTYQMDIQVTSSGSSVTINDYTFYAVSM